MGILCPSVEEAQGTDIAVMAVKKGLEHIGIIEDFATISLCQNLHTFT